MLCDVIQPFQPCFTRYPLLELLTENPLGSFRSVWYPDELQGCKSILFGILSISINDLECLKEFW